MNAFSRRLGKKQGNLFLSLLHNIVLEFLANTISQEKGIKGTQFRMGEIKLALFEPDMVVLVENPKKSKK